MEAGPNKLFDDENFICVFQHCVHFIGCVNVLEEQDKEQGQTLNLIQLLNLRQLCQDCLQVFDNLSQNWVTKNDSQLNQGIIETFHIVGRFKKLISEDIKYLDDEAKNASLPDIVKRLELIIESLISHREMLHYSILNSSNTSNTIACDVRPVFNQDGGLYTSLFNKINLMLCRFNTLCTQRQDTIQPGEEKKTKVFLDSHSKPL